MGLSEIKTAKLGVIVGVAFVERRERCNSSTLKSFSRSVVLSLTLSPRSLASIQMNRLSIFESASFGMEDGGKTPK